MGNLIIDAKLDKLIKEIAIEINQAYTIIGDLCQNIKN